MLHKINLFLSNFRSIPTLTKRSSKWHSVQKDFLEINNECAACGSNKHLQVHHIKPFHLAPELELDPNNLITLCMDKNECHLRVAHGSNWRGYCSNIKEYISQIKNKEKTIKEIWDIAKSNINFK